MQMSSRRPRASRPARHAYHIRGEGETAVSTDITNARTVQEETKGVSRRGFLGGAGILAGGALAASAAVASVEEAQPAEGEIAPAIGHINHLSYICTGCRTCELICALTHEKVINPQLSRNIVNIDYGDAHRTNVLYCQQCEDPKCLKACPTGALHVDPETGARVIDQDVCIGCQTCLNACIYAQGGQGESRIKFNPETNTCFKCDLCGGDPQCVKFCPLGASQASWIEYAPIVRPGIDDYEEKSVEGAIEGITFNKDYTGPHAGKAQDEMDWALVQVDGGVQVQGQVTSSDGAELRVTMHCEFFDADGNSLGTSDEHQWCLTMHEHLAISFDFAIDDPSQIASVTLVANVTYWVAGVDEEY